MLRRLQTRIAMLAAVLTGAVLAGALLGILLGFAAERIGRAWRQKRGLGA